jgi:hypothetical protein
MASAPSLEMFSMFDDMMSFYRDKDHDVNDNPKSCTIVCRKIVIAHWLSFVRLRYLNLLCASSLVSVTRSPTNYVNRTSWLNKSLDLPRQKGVFENLVNARFKLDALLKEISGNMAAMGLTNPIDNTRQGTTADDWEMQGWKEVVGLTTYMVQMMNILTQAYQHATSIQEAQTANNLSRSVAKITNLVIIFTPISVISGIFSMGGNFSPGESKSWVFWAVTCPVVTIISLILFTSLVPFISSKLRWTPIRDEEHGEIDATF